MVNVTIDLKDTSGYAPALGDRVIFEAKRLAGSETTPGRVITTAPVEVPLRNGVGEVDLEPGATVMRVKARNYRDARAIEFDVPAVNRSMTLRELLEDAFTYSPSVIQEAQLYKVQAREAAERAEAAAAVVGSAQRVGEWADASEAASKASEAFAEAAKESSEASAESAAASAGSAAEAADSASAAAVSAGEAAGEASALVRSEFEGLLSGAEAARDAAGVSEVNAAQSEAGAAGHAELAEQHKTAAELARDDAAQSKSDAALSASSADGAAGAAATSASGAAQSESSAAAHAQSALGYAGQAEDARDESRTARDEAVQAAENAQQGAPSDGWKKHELSQPVQDSLSRADTALQSMPVATGQAPGAIRLSGDLGGTAQAPTVPGLAGKADAVHTHSSSQVDGLDAALARLSNIRAWFRGEGPPPESIPGAQVGDWWLDTTTMELHEITGV